MHPLITKAPSKLGTKRNFFNLIKGICKNPTANNIFNRKIECYSLKTGNKTRIFTLTTSTQYYTEGFSHYNKARKRNNRNID